MTLPFEGKEFKNKRKFQCFVCGVEFLNWPEYRDHILEEHEEGRDYVKCPLIRCGAPVRDLRAHFKCKHPSEKMPKVPQVRSMIWKDWGGRKKKGKPKTKVNFNRGWHESTKMGKKFEHRSGMEKEVFLILDTLDEVQGYEVEPFKLDYIHQGEPRQYIPDIVVKFIDGHTELWEVKPSSQTHLEINQDKWHYARKVCAQRDWDFVVVTEKIVDQLKKQLHLQEGMKNDRQKE